MPSEKRYPIECRHTSCALYRTCGQLGLFVSHPDQHPDEFSALDVLFISDHASMDETTSYMSMLSDEGKLIREVMEQFPTAKWGFVYLARGWPVEPSTISAYRNGQRVVKQFNSIHELTSNDLKWARTISFASAPHRRDTVQKCSEHLNRDLDVWRPRLIIAMSNTVKDALFPFENKPITALQHATNKTYRGSAVRFATSPTGVLKNPSGRAEWIQRVSNMISGKAADHDMSLPTARILRTMDEVREYITFLKNFDGDVAIDCETENLNKRYKNRIATIQFSTDTISGVVLPYNHKESPFSPDEMTEVKDLLFDLFAHPSKIRHWVGHNLKFECNMFRSAIGTPLLSAPMYDTQIGAFLLDENRRERAAEMEHFPYSLKQLALDYLNFAGYDQGILKIRAEGTLFDVELEALAVYGCIDTAKTLALMIAELEQAELQGYTEKLLNLMYFFATLEIELFNEIEFNGFPVDRHYLRKLLARDSPVLSEIKAIENRVAATPEGNLANDIILNLDRVGQGQKGFATPLFRKPWAFSFSKQTHPQTLFFKILGLPQKPKEKQVKGYEQMLSWSVDKEWQDQNSSHPLVAEFKEWVLYRKMYDSFVAKLYNRIDPVTGDPDCNPDSRIRANYMLSSVVTGRVACNNPNIQACVTGDTLVVTEKGLMTAERAISETIKWHNGRKLENFEHPISRIDAEIYEVKTSRNTVLKCTADHLHHVLDENCSLQVKKTTDLSDTDYLIQSIEPWLDNFEGDCLVSNETARLWGYLISEGYLARVRKPVAGRKKYTKKDGTTKYYYGTWQKRGSYSFCTTDKAILDDFLRCYDASDLPTRSAGSIKEQTRPGRRILYTVSFGSVEFYNFLQENGLASKAGEKSVPEFILRAGKETIRQFLVGLFSGDGTTNFKHFQAASYCSSSKELTDQIHALLLGFGIPASVRYGPYTTKAGVTSILYVLRIHGKYVSFFHREIGVIGRRNDKRLITGSDKFTTQNYDIVPYIARVLRQSPFKSHYLLWKTPDRTIGMSQKKILDLNIEGRLRQYEPDHKTLPVIELIKAHRIQFARVRSVIELGIKETAYDVTMPQSATFWANGILTHNCPRPENPAKKAIKDIFRSIPGEMLIQLDFKANEMRWAGIVSQDPGMAENFRQGKHYLDLFRQSPDNKDLLQKATLYGDIHKMNASKAFSKPLEEVTKNERQVAKGISFGILFDSSEKSIAEMYSIPVDQVKDMFDRFYTAHYALKEWKFQTKWSAIKTGYAESPHGRRRRLPILYYYRNEIVPENYTFRMDRISNDWRSGVAEALRQATNSVIQGISSDCAMIGGGLFNRHIALNRKPWTLHNAVHDSAVFSVPISDVEEAVAAAEHCFTTELMEYMNAAFDINFNLPIEVDFDVGVTWGSMKAWNFDPRALPKLVQEALDEAKEYDQ